jgi:hypothetical protein
MEKIMFLTFSGNLNVMDSCEANFRGYLKGNLNNFGYLTFSGIFESETPSTKNNIVVTMVNHQSGLVTIIKDTFVIGNVTNYGKIQSNAGTWFQLSGNFINYGKFDAKELPLQFSSGTSLINELGTWEVSSHVAYNVPNVSINGGVLQGDGSINGTIEHYNGAIDIGKKIPRIFLTN